MQKSQWFCRLLKNFWTLCPWHKLRVVTAPAIPTAPRLLYKYGLENGDISVCLNLQHEKRFALTKSPLINESRAHPFMHTHTHADRRRAKYASACKAWYYVYAAPNNYKWLRRPRRGVLHVVYIACAIVWVGVWVCVRCVCHSFCQMNRKISAHMIHNASKCQGVLSPLYLVPRLMLLPDASFDVAHIISFRATNTLILNTQSHTHTHIDVQLVSLWCHLHWVGDVDLALSCLALWQSHSSWILTCPESLKLNRSTGTRTHCECQTHSSQLLNYA